MNVDEEQFILFEENSESDYFSDSDGPSSKKAKLSSHASSSLADPLQDNRSFARFMKEEKLVEVVRDWDTPTIGSICEIKDNGELWIDVEKTHVIISKATQDEMKKQKLWGQRMKIGYFGYVYIGSDIVKLHNKLAKPKKDSDFHDLLDADWKGKKEDLIVLHLDDCPFNFNLEKFLNNDNFYLVMNGYIKLLNENLTFISVNKPLHYGYNPELFACKLNFE